MIEKVWIAAITSSAFTAVLNQGIVTWREQRVRSADRGLVSVDVALSLEAYGDLCAKFAGEQNDYIKSHNDPSAPHYSIPKFPELPSNVELKTLGVVQISCLKELGAEVIRSNKLISTCYEYDMPNGGDEIVFSEAVRLGLRAYEIAGSIRTNAKISPVCNDHVDVIDWMREMNGRIEVTRKRRERTAVPQSGGQEDDVQSLVLGI